MSTLNFTKSEERINRQNPEKAPWLALGFENGKREDWFIFGQKKAKAFLDHLEAMNESFNIHNPESDGLWEYAIELNQGTEFSQKIIITAPKPMLLNNYKKDIAAYLERHPLPVFARNAIEKPYVSTEIVGLDYMPILHLPTYQKKETDIGEGLIPMRVTQKKAKFVLELAFRDSEFGSSMNAFKMAVAENRPELIDRYTSKTGEVRDIHYTLDQMKAYLKYKAILLEFAMSGSFTEE